ncbi:MAG TPA: hypothetical protein VLG50_06865 [Candidatus Saccharimonadales bacterium]|nr:hypothetical protein [Candidatus Saccharimonadales bacterium]
MNHKTILLLACFMNVNSYIHSADNFGITAHKILSAVEPIITGKKCGIITTLNMPFVQDLKITKFETSSETQSLSLHIFLHHNDQDNPITKKSCFSAIIPKDIAMTLPTPREIKNMINQVEDGFLSPQELLNASLILHCIHSGTISVRPDFPMLPDGRRKPIVELLVQPH